jgi:hypothetical protein
LAAELAPVSRTLSEAAGIGLRALDDLENHRAADKERLQKDTQALEAARKPQAVLVDMVAPSAQLLVQALGNQH